jgi:hypothetical protein
MTETDIARPRAQGQAIIRTATAASRAKLIAGSGTLVDQAMKVTTEIARTAGTNSQHRVGQRLDCA